MNEPHAIQTVDMPFQYTGEPKKNSEDNVDKEDVDGMMPSKIQNTYIFEETKQIQSENNSGKSPMPSIFPES